MTPNNPKITVLVPAYNAEKYIVKAIDSVLSQSFADFELLVINDGSTDQTENILRLYTDDRIRLINQTNQGIASALNLGLLNARAELIARFDADDICMPERLAMQFRFLEENPDYIIVGSDADYIDRDDNFVFTCRLPAHTNEDISELALTKCPFIHSAVMFRKTPILQAGGYNKNAFAFQDHLLWSKIIKNGKAANLSDLLIQVRLNPESISIDEKWRTKRFHEIKSAALQKGDITQEEGEELRAILKQQNNPKIKEGSYYLLLGKKYLWNNHQPQKARINLRKAIKIHPGRIDSYAIMALSYFPGNFIDWVYKLKTHKA